MCVFLTMTVASAAISSRRRLCIRWSSSADSKHQSWTHRRTDKHSCTTRIVGIRESLNLPERSLDCWWRPCCDPLATLATLFASLRKSTRGLCVSLAEIHTQGKITGTATIFYFSSVIRNKFLYCWDTHLELTTYDVVLLAVWRCWQVGSRGAQCRQDATRARDDDVDPFGLIQTSTHNEATSTA